jgi:hypothetical protein
VVWCGVVWCGVVWCGVVWCGVVWCGVVWCGVSHDVVLCCVVLCCVVLCCVVLCCVVLCCVVLCCVVRCPSSCARRCRRCVCVGRCTTRASRSCSCRCSDRDQRRTAHRATVSRWASECLRTCPGARSLFSLSAALARDRHTARGRVAVLAEVTQTPHVCCHGAYGLCDLCGSLLCSGLFCRVLLCWKLFCRDGTGSCCWPWPHHLVR